MNISQLEHLIRAAGAICESSEILLIGSQAVLPQLGSRSDTVERSIEADISAMPGNERAELIADLVDGALGELSIFSDTYGYYGQGVAPTTAKLPADWQERMVRFSTANTNGVVACLPEKHDIAAAKLIAGRDKDLAFVSELAGLGELDMPTIVSRLDSIADVDEIVRAVAVSRAERITDEARDRSTSRPGLS